eukprot:g5924.t1
METATASRQLPEAVPPVTGFSGLGENAALPAPGPYETPNPFPSYSQFTERLYRQNMFTMKLGLSNIEEALRLEGNPHHKHKRVFVAGTNGKGTISSALSNILCSGSEGSSSTTPSAKWKVGFFSSPHVIDFRERFRIDGVPVGEEVCHKIGVDVLTKYGGTGGNFAASLSPMKKLMGSSESNASTASPSIDGGGKPLPAEVVAAQENGNRPVLTFFELATLMAAKIFAQADVDVAIYEIGLGGRLDAVNGLRPPDLACFATMGFDHCAYLGDTIDRIAYEKFSVLPRYGRAVLGAQEYAEETLGVWRDFVGERQMVKTADLNKLAAGVESDADGEVTSAKPATPASPDDALDSVSEVFVTKSDKELAAFLGKKTLDRHICRHLRTAVVGSRIIAPDKTVEDIRKGLSCLHWPGRMETLEYGGRTFLVDAAHNADGVRSLTRSIKKRGLKVDRVLFGAMRDKDFSTMLGELKSLAFTEIYGCEIGNPRASKKADYDRVAGPDFFSFVGKAPEVLQKAVEGGSETEGVVLVCGSIYLIGEIYETMGVDAGSIWREP